MPGFEDCVWQAGAVITGQTAEKVMLPSPISEDDPTGGISRLAKMRKPQCTGVHEDFRIKRNAEITLLRHPLIAALHCQAIGSRQRKCRWVGTPDLSQRLSSKSMAISETPILHKVTTNR